jgi:L-serine dehydratase
MESIKEIYKIGYGPSSSHTMGPRKAAELFRQSTPGADSYRVTLYGSLAATGKGHGTDRAIKEALKPANADITWLPETFLSYHPNAVKFEAVDKSGKTITEKTFYSVGGGKITDGINKDETKRIYEMTTITEILDWIQKNGSSFWEYVEMAEGPGIYSHMELVWKTMNDAIKRGLEEEGILPGGLNMRRKASSYYIKSKGFADTMRKRTLTFAYALAVSEENAGGGIVVTAPTCGSCGVMPAVLKRIQDELELSDIKIHRALMTAGLFGNVVKEHASISGAEVGCQGEVGTACAMAAAAAAQLVGASPRQIEYAAEMGIEHHLGLTCDPIMGLVQAPCIERNAMAAEKAINAGAFAILGDGTHLVSFDKIVKTMNQTGHDLPNIYKETSEGGMAIFGL